MKPPVFRVLAMALAVSAVTWTAPAEAPAPPQPAAPAAVPEAPPTADAPLAGPEPLETQFWQEDYGDCILSCGWEQYPIYFQTYEECCNTLHLCPDSSYPASKYWSPYYGWPLLCQT